MFNFDNLTANLPDAFRKDKESNNYKLLQIEKVIYDRILDIFRDIENCLDIENCSGATLDMWGQRQQVPRGTVTDEQYLILIKANIAQSFCDGSRNGIAEALAYMLSCNTSEIKIKNGEERNTVEIMDIPFSTVVNSGFAEEQISELIQKIMPIGIKCTINYSGTFELGETFGEQDAEKGLSDLERTVGGYLGMLRRD